MNINPAIYAAVSSSNRHHCHRPPTAEEIDFLNGCMTFCFIVGAIFMIITIFNWFKFNSTYRYNKISFSEYFMFDQPFILTIIEGVWLLFVGIIIIACGGKLISML